MTTRDRMGYTLALVNGMVIGAMAMYIFDENRGAKRRAYARDKLIRAGHLLGRTIRKRGRDLMHRAIGSVAEIRSGIRDRQSEIPDDILIARVRAQLGHVVSHPGLLDIKADSGSVTVRGPVLRNEVEKVKSRLKKIRGVRECHVEVEPHANLDQVAGSRGVRRVQEAI